MAFVLLTGCERVANVPPKPTLAELETLLERQRGRGELVAAAGTAYRLFYAAWEEERYRDALAAAAESGALARAAGDRALEAKAAQAQYTVLHELGDLEAAERALAAGEAFLDPGNRLDRAHWLQSMGAIRLEQERYALAADLLVRAREMAPAAAEERFFRTLELNLVEARLGLGQPEEAAAALAAAEESAAGGGASAISLPYYQARVALARGERARALPLLDLALGQDPSPSWQWELELRRGEVLASLGRLAEAEAAFERSAAAVEQLRGELGFDEFKTSLLERRRQPFEELFRLKAAAGRTQEAVAELERASARSFLDAFITSAVARDSPAIEPAAVVAAADRIEALKALLPALSETPVVALRPTAAVLRTLGERTVLVYFLAGRELWTVRVAGGEIRNEKLAADPAEVSELVDQWLRSPGDPAPARRLGALLLPERLLPRRGSPLHLVTEGALGELPFAALLRKGRFLVEDFDLSYAPSLTALAAIIERRRPVAGGPVVLGDPNGDLPSARREAEAVGLALGVRPVLGASATIATLRASAGTSLLHLASHAGVGPRGPWLGLADGAVVPAELLAAKVAPRLAVLASCESAAGRTRGKSGSLAAGFLAAGSDAVVAALGSVEDEVAHRFVLRFYAEGGADDPVAGLARAQRAAIAAGEPPAHWAPFVVLGTWSSKPVTAR